MQCCEDAVTRCMRIDLELWGLSNLQGNCLHLQRADCNFLRSHCNLRDDVNHVPRWSMGRRGTMSYRVGSIETLGVHILMGSSVRKPW